MSADPRLQRARDGDLQALAALLEEHGPAVRRGLAGSVPDAMRSVLDADDVMQVSYLEAFLHAARLQADAPAAFVAWLRGIAEHNLADAIRELSRGKRPDPRRRVDDSLGELMAQLSARLTTPTRAAARAEMQDWLRHTLASLPADYARVVELYDLQGLAIDEVATAMRRSRGAVHMLRQRAHDALRARLGDADRFLTRAP